MEDNIMKRMGKRIRAARKEAGLSQTILAEKLGVDQSTLSDWESGISSIRATDLPRLAEILNVSILYFFEEDENPHEQP